MRLGIQLLNSDASLNSFKKLSQVVIYQGMDFSLNFQLMNLDQGIRYVPEEYSTVFVEIPRLPEAFGTVNNVRNIVDYSVRRFATNPFAADTSIWRLTLLPQDTANMMSSNIRVTVTEPTNGISISLLPQAIEIFRSESS